MKNEQDHLYLLDPSFLQKLEKMKIITKRMMKGTQSGKRRSRQLGSSIEFADYRTYTPGDDIRQVDWNTFARLEKLFLKTFYDEQEIHVSLYLDASKSMAYGNPTKFHVAKQLAAAFGYLSLHHFDRVTAYAFDQKIAAKLPVLYGKGKVQALFRFLEELDPLVEGDMNQALTTQKAIHGKAGVSIIISDFLFENGYEKAISFIQSTNQEVILVHLLSKEELNPNLQGDVKLIDSESRLGKEITVSPYLLKEYQHTLDSFLAKIQQFANQRGISYLLVHPESSIEETMVQVFKKAGIIR